MKYQPFQTKITKLLLCCAAIGVFFSAFVSTTKAQTTFTFAQFSESAGTNDFRFTSTSTSGTLDTVSGGSPISFTYFTGNINGVLDTSLRGPQPAHLIITPSTTTTNATTNGTTLSQPLDQTITISIIRDTAAPIGAGNGTRRNLLTATISTGGVFPAINGGDLTDAASFTVSTPDQIVTFTSDFLSFAGGVGTRRNLGLGFSSVTPALAIVNGFLQSFDAAGVGTFASNPKPVVQAPTAASVTVGGRVLTPAGRGLSGAHVNLTGTDGITRTVITNSFGYYRFSDIRAGDTAILSVDSKRYYFATQVITVTEDTNNLNFFSEK